MLEFETKLDNLLTILNNDHKEYLEVGDEVIHRDPWGKDAPRVARVTNIIKRKNEGTDNNIRKISWDSFQANYREYIVDLHDNKWAYNYQITPQGGNI